MNINALKYIVEKGADIDSLTHMGFSPIYLLCENNKLEELKYLIKKGTNLECWYNGYTSDHKLIHYACEFSSTDVVMCLINNISDLSCETDDGMTPLDILQNKNPRKYDVENYLIKKLNSTV